MHQSEEMRLAAMRATTAIVNEVTRSKMDPTPMVADVVHFLCAIVAGHPTTKGSNRRLDEFLMAKGFGSLGDLQETQEETAEPVTEAPAPAPASAAAEAE